MGARPYRKGAYAIPMPPFTQPFGGLAWAFHGGSRCSEHFGGISLGAELDEANSPRRRHTHVGGVVLRCFGACGAQTQGRGLLPFFSCTEPVNKAVAEI